MRKLNLPAIPQSRFDLIVNTKKTNTPGTLEPYCLESTAQRKKLRPVNARSDWLTIQTDDEDTFNPYDRTPVGQIDGRPVKRDLRKLSEWIKTLRAVEDRKARGED
jgi:hypothetical protein